MKKAMLTLLVFGTALFCQAQSPDLTQKGKAVFVGNNSANDHAKQLQEDIVSRLKEWGYWKVADNKNDADFIMEIATETSKGITMTSWGGTSVMAKVKLNSKTGQTIWESDGFKSSPNGTNGFNGTKAVSKKIMRALKKKFN